MRNMATYMLTCKIRLRLKQLYVLLHFCKGQVMKYNICLSVFFPLIAFFIRPFYKMMVNRQITLHDMESVVSSPVL